METQTRIAVRASSLLPHNGYLLADSSYRRAAIMLLAAAGLLIFVWTQMGNAGRIKAGAQLAVSRACELLHEADKANRSVRPVPLSLADARDDAPRCIDRAQPAVELA
jgi:hypothetical protein